MRSDFRDLILSCHLCQMNKQPSTLPDGVLIRLPVPREPVSLMTIGFAAPLPSDNKKEVILVVLNRFTGVTYLIPVSVTNGD